MPNLLTIPQSILLRALTKLRDWVAWHNVTPDAGVSRLEAVLAQA